VTAAAGPPPGRVRDGVFISYAREDGEWLRRFQVMLKPVAGGRGFRLWADDGIPPSEAWRRWLTEAIARSSVALLLVSADFLDSSFIMTEELPALIQAGVPLVPVLVSPCGWRHVPQLAEVQWAHDPGRDGPLDTGPLTRGERDGRVWGICERLLELLGPEMAEPAATPVPAEITARDRGAYGVSAGLVGSGVAGRLDGVPALPPGYVDRAAELAGYGEALLGVGSGAVGLAGDTHALGLSGQGGIGKSVCSPPRWLAMRVRTGRRRPHVVDDQQHPPVGQRLCQEPPAPAPTDRTTASRSPSRASRSSWVPTRSACSPTVTQNTPSGKCVPTESEQIAGQRRPEWAPVMAALPADLARRRVQRGSRRQSPTAKGTSPICDLAWCVPL